MDHRALISALPSEDKARLIDRSDQAGLKHLALYAAAIVFCTAGIIGQVPFWPLLMVPQGILLVFLFTLSHECTHKTPFRTPWINETVGHVCAVLIALPFVWFRYFHLAHHKYTNDPDRDPELEGRPRPNSWPGLMIYLSGWYFWRGMVRVLLTNAFGQIDAPYLPPRQHKAMRREARVILALYAAGIISLLFSSTLLWIWLIPLLIGQPFLRLYLLAEHGLCPPVANMLENSRTTYTTRFIRFLAWNMPYHAEHHAYPNVPFHKLPAFHNWTRDHLKSTSDGYAEFTSDYTRSLAR
ncbi:MAG: fatty acid desaturase [Pseudomonadota bacterium]